MRYFVMTLSGADPGFVERGAQRRSRLKTLFGISKGGGAQGACALFGRP